MMYKVTTGQDRCSKFHSHFDFGRVSTIGFPIPVRLHTDGLVQDCSNSIANALELLQSCTKPSISRLNRCSVQLADSPATVTVPLCWAATNCAGVSVVAVSTCAVELVPWVATRVVVAWPATISCTVIWGAEARTPVRTAWLRAPRVVWKGEELFNEIVMLKKIVETQDGETGRQNGTSIIHLPTINFADIPFYSTFQ